MPAHTRWSDLTPAQNAGSDIVAYSPGQEVTNLGLLFTRVYPTYDGTDDNNPVKVSVSAEQTALGGTVKPTASTLGTLYGTKDFYTLPCIEKTVPGFDNPAIWTLMTDNPDEFVGRSYSGKAESVSTLKFVIPTVFDLISDFTEHLAHNSIFTVLMCYDDGNLDNLYYIVVPRCSLAGLGSSPQKNNSGGLYRVEFKPMGGQFIPKFIRQPRTSN